VNSRAGRLVDSFRSAKAAGGHDNFFGGEPYGGRTAVLFREKLVWMMVFSYGCVAADLDADRYSSAR
jgi:hypothetical protein